MQWGKFTKLPRCDTVHIDSLFFVKLSCSEKCHVIVSWQTYVQVSKKSKKKNFVNKRTIYWHPWNLSSCFNPRIGSVNVKDQTLLQDLQPALHIYWLAGIRSMEHFLPQRFFFSCKQVFFLDEININRCVLSSISGWDERFSNHRSRIKRVRRTMAQDRIKCLKHCLSPYDFFPPIQQFFLFLLHYNKYI